MKTAHRNDGRIWGGGRISAIYAMLAVGAAMLAAGIAGGIDRQFQLRSIQGPLDAEVLVRGQSLRDTLDRYRIVSVLVARGAVVREIVADDRPGDRLMARLQALAAMSNLRAVQIRVARSGNRYASGDVGFLAGSPVLQSGETVALQGRLGREVLRNAAGHPIYVYFAPVFGDGRIDGVVLAAVDLEDLESSWSLGQSAVLAVGSDGRPMLWNKAWNGGPVVDDRSDLSARLELPDLGWTLIVSRRKPDWLGAWLVRPAGAGLLMLLLAAVFFSLVERRRYLTALAEARRNDAELLEAEVRTRTAELQAAQDQVVQAGKLALLGQMSASISHEINQPLGAIRTYCETAGRFLERDDPRRARENLGHIDRLVGRISRIVTNLRSFATNEPQAPRALVLGAVVATASGEFLDRFPEAAPFFHMRLDTVAGDAYVMAGEVRLLQVINNLLTNAWMAVREDPEARIILATGQDDGWCRIDVEDNGPGISQALTEEVFEAFISTRAPGTGMGLGLTISRSFVESMGGSIALEPEAAGARFVIRLRPADH